MKHFFALVKKVTKLKRPATLVRGIKTADHEAHLDPDSVNRIIVQHLAGADGVIYGPVPPAGAGSHPDIRLHELSEPFSLDELQAALKSCNFNKGLGDDAFDGRVLLKDLCL